MLNFFPRIILSILLSHFLLVVLSEKSKILSSNQKNSKIASLPKLPADFLAGGIAGTIASTLTAPLEVIKTQMQSSQNVGKYKGALSVAKTIFKSEGYKGFFRGVKPLLVGIIPTRAIYFWSYSFSKKSLNEHIGDTSLNHLSSAFFAGVCSNTIMNPLWMVKTRFQLFVKSENGAVAPQSYMSIIKGIWKDEGIKGFYRGLSASYFGCIEGGIQWVVYENIKKKLSERNKMLALEKSTKNNQMPNKNKLTPQELFISAAFSKFVAICITYPHEVVRIRLREQSVGGVYKYSSFLGALKTIAKEEGYRGLYSGMGIHIMRSVPNAAIMFLSYELAANWLKNNPTDQSVKIN